MSIHTRRATAFDLDAIEAIYDRIHDECERGRACTGWIRGVYPTRATAQAALERGDLFVQEADGRVAGCAIINQAQRRSRPTAGRIGRTTRPTIR